MIFGLIGLGAGVLSGLVGIGGGIVIVPALVYFAKFSQLEAQGTTLALLTLPVVILGSYTYYKSGNVNFLAVGIMAMTFLVGGLLGSKIALNINHVTLSRLFGLLLLIIGMKMILTK